MNPVADHFEKLSPRYTQHFFERRSGTNFSFRKRLELACELAAHSSGRLLDCACGTGEITCALLKSGRFQHATINDISTAMQQRACELLEAEIANTELTFVQSDIFQLTPNGEKFDLIVCLGLIAHVGRLDVLFPHLKSLLAPNGRILLQTTLADHPFTRIVRAVSAGRYFKQHGYWISYFRHDDIANACKNAALRIAETRRHSVGIPFGDRIWPWGNYQIEVRLQKWASQRGTDALYLLAPT
jgi:2-polyprenyl-3-methyl-5-hydroxy-6-metoxy-1,4-benzoquinol methylase